MFIKKYGVFRGRKALFVSGLGECDLRDTFECGQCIRWEEGENGSYIGVVENYVIELSLSDDEVLIKRLTDAFNNIDKPNSK